MRDSGFKSGLLKVYDAMWTAKDNLKLWLVLRTYYRLRIMSPKQTMKYIQRNNCSIARFGDGELSFALKDDHKISFQQNSEELARMLKAVLEDQNEKLLICMPGSMNSLAGCTKECKAFWWWWGKKDDIHKRVVNEVRLLAGRDYVFGDARITRPYMDRKSRSQAKAAFVEMKKLWAGRDILIVEGTQTRLGVGNDLFDDARSIKRVLAPAVGAFECYEAIKQALLELVTDELVLLALGPTATVLAADLARHGMQALDIGHVDIEYEWFLMDAKSKIAVEGKYTNEASGGQDARACTDEKYLSQILITIT